MSPGVTVTELIYLQRKRTPFVALRLNVTMDSHSGVLICVPLSRLGAVLLVYSFYVAIAMDFDASVFFAVAILQSAKGLANMGHSVVHS